MRVRYRPTALAQLDAIFTYIEARNPHAAARVLHEIKRSIDRLADFPYSSRTGEVPGIRELPIARYPYIVFYRSTMRPARCTSCASGTPHKTPSIIWIEGLSARADNLPSTGSLSGAHDIRQLSA